MIWVRQVLQLEENQVEMEAPQQVELYQSFLLEHLLKVNIQGLLILIHKLMIEHYTFHMS